MDRNPIQHKMAQFEAEVAEKIHDMVSGEVEAHMGSVDLRFEGLRQLVEDDYRKELERLKLQLQSNLAD